MEAVVVRQKHEQIKDFLKKELLGTKYLPGDRFPSQNELAEQFKVSPLTARVAMAALVEEGFLTKTQGKGTFVRSVSPALSEKEVVVLALPTTGHLFEPFVSNLVRGLMQYNLFPLVIDIGQDGKNGYSKLKLLIEKQPAFLVVNQYAAGIPIPLLKRYQGHIVYIEALSETHEDISASYVLSDMRKGGMQVAEHLISAGYRRIIYYTQITSFNMNSFCLVEDGIRTALKKHALPEDNFVHWYNEGEQSLIKRLKKEKLPVAIIGNFDWRLKPVYDTAGRLGLRIPEDIGLVGWNNTPWCETFRPHLTSVSIREDLMARKVIEVITDKTMQGKKILIPPKLVVRDSAGRCD